MADQIETYKAEKKFTGFWLDPDNVVIVGLDVPEEVCPDLADPDRIHLPLDPAFVDNVARFGVKETIFVTKVGENVCVTKGRQRVRAAREANRILGEQGNEFRVLLRALPAMKGSDLLTDLILENEFRQDDSVIAKARKAQRLRERGANEDEIAAVYGKSKTTLKNWASLMAAPDVAKAVEKGKLTPSVAYEVAKVAPAERAAALAAAIESGGKGFAAAEPAQRIRNGQAPAPQGERRMPLKAASLAKLEGLLGPEEGEEYKDNEGDLEMAYAMIQVIRGGSIALVKEWPNLYGVLKKVVRSPKVKKGDKE